MAATHTRGFGTGNFVLGWAWQVATTEMTDNAGRAAVRKSLRANFIKHLQGISFAYATFGTDELSA